MIWERIMNTWGYLIAIALLLLLAGVMLYARFSSRGSARVLHHQAPGEWTFYPERISTAPIEPLAAIETDDAALRIERPVVTSAADATAHPERDYLDELQEAAAGLARLMRSSPVTRSEPVIYAPEAVEESPVTEVLEVAEESATEELTEIEEEIFAEEVVAAETSDVPEIVVEPVSRQALLGEVVWEQLGKIDEALETLDNLVSSIASGLLMLSGAGEVVEEGLIEVADPIAAAA